MLNIALRTDAWISANAWRRLSADNAQLTVSVLAFTAFVVIIALIVYSIVQRFEALFGAHFDDLTGLFPQLVGLPAYFMAGGRVQRALAWCATGWLSAFPWTRREVFSYGVIRVASLACTWLVVGSLTWVLVLVFLDRELWPYLPLGVLEILGSVILASALGVAFSRMGVQSLANSRSVGQAAAISLGLLLVGSVVYLGATNLLWLIGKGSWSMRLVSTLISPLALAGLVLATARLWFLRLPANNIQPLDWNDNAFVAAQPDGSVSILLQSIDRWRVRCLSLLMSYARRTNRLLVKHEIVFRLVVGILALAFVEASESDPDVKVLFLGIGGGLLALWVSSACVHSVEQLFRLIRPLPVSFATIVLSIGRLPWLAVGLVAVVMAVLTLPSGLLEAVIVILLVLGIGEAMITLRIFVMLAYPGSSTVAGVVFVTIALAVVVSVLSTGALGLAALFAAYCIYGVKARRVWNGNND